MSEPTTEAMSGAALGRLTVEATPYELNTDTSIVVTRVADNERVQVTNLEQHLDAPTRPRGTVSLHSHLDFATYTNRLGDPAETTVWADVDKISITSVLNDHTDQYIAGWRDNRVVLQMRRDKDWAQWVATDNRLMQQGEFAELIEGLVHTVSKPSAADMLEVSRTFQAKRNASYSSATRLDSGDVQFAYEVETSAKAGGKGQLEVPTEFELNLPVFYGTDSVQVRARLRYRVEHGDLRIGYALLRADLVERAAFELVLGQVCEGLETSAIYNGTAPTSLRADR